MKHIMNRLCVVATALAMSFGLSQCAKDELKEASDEQVYVTITASKGEMTKADLNESGTDMAVTWSENDKLYAVGETDGFLGSLVLTEGNGMTSGKFGGNINYLTSKQNVRFYYVGKNKSITGNTYSLSLASQAGTLDDIENSMHVMVGTLNNVAASTVNFGSVTMQNMISIIKVDTQTSFGEVSEIEVKNANASASINLKTGAVTPSTGNITLTSTASTAYYMAILPDAEFKYYDFVKGDKTVWLSGKIVVEGKYFTSNGNSVPLGSTEHTYVDLGCSVLWSTTNLDASSPVDFGEYYAWGEICPYYKGGIWNTTTKMGAGGFVDSSKGYAWESYCNGSSSFSEWPNLPYDTGTNRLLPMRDAATMTWKYDKCWTPTMEECTELYNKCYWVYYDGSSKQYQGSSIKGYVVFKRHSDDSATDPKATNSATSYYSELDNHIFLPFGGQYDGIILKNYSGSDAEYPHFSIWTSTRNYKGTGSEAVDFCAAEPEIYIPDFNGENRCKGFTIRPVKERVPLLPPEYTELTYLRSEASQGAYINTEFNHDKNTGFEAQFMPSYHYNNNCWGNLFSARESDHHRQFGVNWCDVEDSHRYAKTGRFEHVRAGSEDSENNCELTMNAVNTVKCINSYFTSAKNNTNFVDTSEYDAYGPVYIFALNQGGGVSEYCTANLYYLKFYSGSTLVRHYIPARRKSDSVLGLYEIFQKQFFTNAGSGTFYAGADVTY